MHNNCQNCGSKLNLSYCGNCGEKKFDKNSLSITALIKHIFISITDIDGTFFTSLKLLVLKPGQLTLDYLNGVRKYRLYPFQLFIYINILYFFLVSFTHQNTFSTPLDVHINAENFIHVDFAKSLVKTRLEKTGETLEQYTLKFNKKIESYSKILIFTMIPLFSLVVFLVFFRRRYIGIKSLIYATHFISMTLAVMICIIIVMHLLSLLAFYILSIESEQIFSNDIVFSGLILGWLAVYLYYSIRRVFKSSITMSFIQSTLLIITFYYSIIVYRAVLFFVTYYSLTI